MGLLRRKLQRERKLRVPQKYKRSLWERVAYKEIQQEACRLYCQEREKEQMSKVTEYFGIFKANAELVRKVATDKDFFYEP